MLDDVTGMTELLLEYAVDALTHTRDERTYVNQDAPIDLAAQLAGALALHSIAEDVYAIREKVEAIEENLRRE